MKLPSPRLVLVPLLALALAVPVASATVSIPNVPAFLCEQRAACWSVSDPAALAGGFTCTVTFFYGDHVACEGGSGHATADTFGCQACVEEFGEQCVVSTEGVSGCRFVCNAWQKDPCDPLGIQQ